MFAQIRAYWRTIQSSRLYRSGRFVFAVVGLVATIQFAWTQFDRLTPDYFVVGLVDPMARVMVRYARLEWPYDRDCVNPIPEEHGFFDGSQGHVLLFKVGGDLLYGRMGVGRGCDEDNGARY